MVNQSKHNLNQPFSVSQSSADTTPLELGLEEKWNAVLGNDASYNETFLYAVKTTGIFCRPSCKSRPPNPDNITYFDTAEQAESAGFRPCKRCKPTGQRLPDDEWIASVTDYIDHNYRKALTLELLAEICHGSPYHLHRTFRKLKQMTPVAYIQQQRIEKAKELLLSSDHPVSDIGVQVGLANTPYFITLFKKLTGHTPASFRKEQTIK
ncbi:bifunctional transcriptional activator/DNA repair enzyme AdaA [Paenibacillus sp. LHD-38]|uniref:bifunctional transcriptional activator/DNA repair enzyme AdaA n=1 Tax=Paenibacillus sp. LHD-38 TaxID=3072143 RepID=UPI00280DB47F|nr:bifunctional transcriptional activator/DNA repair enzyme AdaA [Paenibacillus sp. LHD-38]MDQ8737013.1 bifunctional transcriptional activator/DNA repair enzyme AdaA [Paenibacillus sp. LHD-38]